MGATLIHFHSHLLNSMAVIYFLSSPTFFLASSNLLASDRVVQLVHSFISGSAGSFAVESQQQFLFIAQDGREETEKT